MSDKIKILAFAGSSRKDSFNKQVVKAAIPLLEKEGAEVTYLDLKDYTLPVYDGDDEQEKGLPPNARKLKDLFIASDGFFISSPEYNGSYSGLFKNLIDWLSRPCEGFPPYECFKGKTAGLASASDGRYGAIRSLTTVRKLLSHVQLLVIPEQLSIPGVSKAFNDDGSLVNERHQKSLESVCSNLVKMTRLIKS